jgi:hypothetical protein
LSIDDHRRVMADLPSHKDDGSAFTEADLGSGGYRNDDGTLSALVQNLRFFDGHDEVKESPSDDDPEGDGDVADDVALLAAAAVGAAVVGGGMLAWQYRADIAESINARVTEPLKAHWRELRPRQEPSAELTSLLDSPHDEARPTITRAQQQQLREEATIAMDVLHRNAHVLKNSDVLDDDGAMSAAMTPAQLETNPGQHRIDAVLIESEQIERRRQNQHR